LFYAVRATLNVSAALQMGMTDADISSLESAIQELYADDPRYESTTTKAVLSGGELTIQLSAVTIRGQRITLKISDDGTGLEYERLN
jgi:anti-sigma regulatory factor (Ser/Thr protein kinase)